MDLILMASSIVLEMCFHRFGYGISTFLELFVNRTSFIQLEPIVAQPHGHSTETIENFLHSPISGSSGRSCRQTDSSDEKFAKSRISSLAPWFTSRPPIHSFHLKSW